MKYLKLSFLISFIFVSAGFKAFCQDTIYKTNGTEIQAKILEITSSEIKYKRFDNLQGPTIYMPKAEVFMIKYENGTKEIINQQPGQEKKKQEVKTEVKKDEPE